MGSERTLNLLDIFGSALAAMISSGIFILPAFLFPEAGSSMILSYALAGFFFLIAVLSHGEMISAFSETGESRFLPYRGMGPFMGTINGLAIFSSMILKASFALFGLAYTLNQFSGLPFLLCAVLCLTFLTALQFFKTRNYTLKTLSALALIFLSAAFISRGIPRIQPEYLNIGKDFPGIFPFLGHTAFLFIAYGGFQGLADPSRKIRNPGMTIPMGIFVAALCITVIYVLGSGVIAGTGAKSSPEVLILAQTAGIIAGSPAKMIFILAGALAFFITAETSFFSAYRYLRALSKDSLIPSFFQKSPSLNTPPVAAILLTALFIVAPLGLDLESMIRIGSASVILASLLTCLSLIILKESKTQTLSASFKAPFYPGLQILTSLIFLFMLFQLGTGSLLLTLSLTMLSGAAWIFYGRKRNEKESALLRLIERIAHREIAKRTGQEEIQKMLQDKDPEHFKILKPYLENSLILDLPKKSDISSLFEVIAEQISRFLPVNPHDFFELLLKRENQGSTAVNSFAAIPHILIPGEKIFKIMLIRCRPGIFFSSEAPSVQCVFVLAGTLDNRGLHLKAVSALAKALQNQSFEERWMKARNSDELKQLFFTAEKSRDDKPI